MEALSWKSSSKSGEDFDEEVTTIISTIGIIPEGASSTLGAGTKWKWGSSMQGHRPNKRRRMEQALIKFDQTYFSQDRIYDKKDFERCFRMAIFYSRESLKGFWEEVGLFIEETQQGSSIYNQIGELSRH